MFSIFCQLNPANESTGHSAVGHFSAALMLRGLATDDGANYLIHPLHFRKNYVRTYN
jgi:hypothetical protein